MKTKIDIKYNDIYFYYSNLVTIFLIYILIYNNFREEPD